MKIKLIEYKNEVEAELKRILHYWIKYAIDEDNGGFFGKINHNNEIDFSAAKGVVLHARILWTFSAAYRLTNNTDYLLIAKDAYNFLNQFFSDKVYGGFYWTVNNKGISSNQKKHVYAQAFVLYAYCEFYKITDWEEVLVKAKSIFSLLEEKSFDTINGGYKEAFTRDWQLMQDARLSEKDSNDVKSANTHLHLLEAYSNLYIIWKDETVKKQIQNLLSNFSNHIIHPHTKHLQLFFDENWNCTSSLISYGHDIEASWLLFNAATIINDNSLITIFSSVANELAIAAATGLDNDGGMWYECNESITIKQKHWWPQAEAMIGFFNEWQLNKQKNALEQSINSWNFIKKYIIDYKKGEWLWGVYEDYTAMLQEDKVGLWKCPYHNSRACMEIINRINLIIQ